MRSAPRAVGGWVAIVAGVLAQAAACCAEPAAGSVWRTDFAQAQADAKKLNRPILIHFYADWCVPCQKMDRETLRSPELLRLLDVGYVAVKINFDRTPDGAQRYKPELLPADIIVGPDGRVLHQSVGYQKKDEYIATVHAAEVKFAATRKAPVQIATGPTITPAKSGNEEKKPAKAPDLAAAEPSNKPKLPPLPNDPVSAEPDLAIAAPETPPKLPMDDAPQIEVALDGYCPVTLYLTRSWKLGEKDFSTEHQGQVYHFTSAKQQAEFKANPAKYAPKLLGCDPVLLSETNIATPGTTRYGAYYEGELFLFETAATRSRFRSNPVQYTRTKHVLKPDDVQRRR